MILTCPNCGTQYVVKDGAIPPEGRQVRCAACKHSWHQEPETTVASEVEEGSHAHPADAVDLPGAAAAVRDEQPSSADESLAGASLIEPRSGPEAEERAYEEALIDGAEASPERLAANTAQDESVVAAEEPQSPALAASAVTERPAEVADWDEPPTAEPVPDEFSPFAQSDQPEPRQRSPLLTILIIIIILVAAAALFWFLAPPAIKAKLGLAAAAATPLQLVTTHMERTPLESGNELLTVTGRVINPSAKEQEVPPIQAQLKNRSGKIVYSWTIQPPAHSLAAGASASFNSAEVNVPPGADELTITLGEPQV